MLSRVVAWLAATEGSIALHESLYMYPLVETVHVIGIMLFAGTIAMVDLRLLGRAFTDTPVSEMTSRILPWTVAGFAVMAVTGMLLFYAIPVRTYHSVWFRLKLVLLATDRASYGRLCALITRGRMRTPKGQYRLEPGHDLRGELRRDVPPVPSERLP